jgi:hypothetical protein
MGSVHHPVGLAVWRFSDEIVARRPAIEFKGQSQLQDFPNGPVMLPFRRWHLSRWRPPGSGGGS